jgi:trehalose-6-phosphate synthase
MIPWSREIIESLLACDYVGFHIPRYCENIVDTARSHYSLRSCVRQACGERFQSSGGALCVERMTTRIECAGRSVMLGAHPVGVDLERIRRSIATPEFSGAVQALTREQSGKKIIISAERLDYMKGPLRKLQAYERFLALYPAWREKITFIDICAPPAAGMSVYDDIRSQVEQAVGRINGRFATPTWSPITFMYRQEPFERLAAYLAVADVAWITSLRDGLNLVAKEYVAIRGELQRAGVLIVSEFAGCSVELAGALPTNPYDITEMASTLQQALLMDEREQAERMSRLAAIVRRHDVNQWAQDFIRCAEAAGEIAPHGNARRPQSLPFGKRLSCDGGADRVISGR